jgi:hypothetical protein
MRPERELDAAPRQMHVGVMAFLLRQRANAIDELERRAEVRKDKDLTQVVLVPVLVHELPTVEFTEQQPDGLPAQGFDAAFTRDAVLANEIDHPIRISRSSGSRTRHQSPSRTGEQAIRLRG